MLDNDHSFTVADDEAGSRLDRFVSRHTGLSRASATRLIEGGQVRIGIRRGRKGTVLERGDVVVLDTTPLDPLSTPPVPQPEMPLAVLYTDEDVVAVSKPAGLPSHPLRAGERGTIASALVARFPECVAAGEYPREGGLCHRLDIFTSGALLAARSREAWHALRAAFHDGQVDKEYLALVVGSPLSDEGQVSLPLVPDKGRADRMTVADRPELEYHPGALDAETRFVVERRGPGLALLRVRAHTGRRHQIRAHLSYLGLPLYGDVLYGGPAMSEEVAAALGPDHYAEAQGQFLHAEVLRFPAPGAEGGVGVVIREVRAPLPEARERLLSILFSLKGP